MTDQSESSRFPVLFELALADYEIKTRISLGEHPVARELENCHSIESISTLLQDQARTFGQFRGKDRIMKSIRCAVSFLYRLSATAALGEGIGLAFTPVKALTTGLGVLLAQAAKGTADSYDALVDLLEAIEHFLKLLEIYTEVPQTPAMNDLAVKIMVELLSALALATKELKQGRSRIFAGDKHTSAVLHRLDRLTLDKARTTAAEILKVVYSLIQDMNGKSSADSAQDALETLHEMASGMEKSKRDKLLQDIRNWLSPPDPWKNHNIALGSRHEGTATWFVQGDVYSEWKSSGPSSLLWIHGKPGAGKSVLCSTIIENIDNMRKCGLVSLAFFYHDFREDQKSDLRGLLSSVLSQFCDQSDAYYDILSKLYSTHRSGAQTPSDDTLGRCLEEILKLPGQAPIFLIVDALDECSNTSPMPSHREKVLALVVNLIDSRLPNLRVCVTSRPEVDIKVVLGPLTFQSISLQDERGQMEDIERYIKSVVEKDPRNRRWTAQDKQLVIDTLTRNADGMFRWVYCQVLYLRGCHPGRIRHALAELPETLDETYERTLQEINKADWELAHRLFQCVAVASRPLRVEELAEFLAFDFDAGPTPRFNEGWRLEDPIKAVQSTCPSFLVIVDIGGSQIIQFSHFSVKEFLTSSRLAEAKQEISRYHISTTPAHTLVAKACLGILLHLDQNVAKDVLQRFPLTPYAALHWFDHARFEGVSRNVEDGMNTLLDSSKPHLAIWVSLHNTELPSWKLFKRGEKPLPPSGIPLHYATICGLHTFVRVLINQHPHNVDTRGFDNLTPLHMASLRGYEEVAHVLLEGDADVTAQNNDNQTPLHMASGEGHLQVVRALLAYGASTTARDMDGLTPLHLVLEPRDVEDPHAPNSGVDPRAENGVENGPAQLCGALEIDFLSYLFSQEASVQVTNDPFTCGMHATAQGNTLLYMPLRHRYTGPLLSHLKPEANGIAGNKGEWTHLAPHSEQVEVMQLLLKHGADPTAEDNNGLTPLHLASQNGHVEVVQFLVEHDAVPTVQNEDGWTPLHVAALNGHIEVAQFLVEHGANPTVQAKDGLFPLHLAAFSGHVGVTQFLVEYGTNPTVQNEDGWSPLHWAACNGHVEVIQFLVEHGGDRSVRLNDGKSPLHLAALHGHVEVAQLLVEHGADPTVQAKDGLSPLHLAAFNGHVEVTQFLVEHGTNPTVQNEDGWSPLHWAAFKGHVEVTQFLVEHGADPTVQDKDGSSPLYTAASNGHVELVQFLVEHGADPSVRFNNGWSPLHLVAFKGHVKVVQLLVEHGADPTVQERDGLSPLHLAALNGHVEVAQFLVEHGADPSIRLNDGRSPLHLATVDEHVKVSQFIGAHGVDPIVQDKNGLSTLHWAALIGYIEVVKFLIEHLTDPTVQGKNGLSLWHLAALKGHIEVAQFFVVHGAHPTVHDNHGQSPLHLAALNGHVEFARFLVEHGADPSVQLNNGRSPLHLAAFKGHVEVAQFLVVHGAYPTVQDKDGLSPLHLAALNGHVEVTKFLVMHGVHPTVRNKDGLSPLHLAALNGHVEVVQLLVEHGADPTVQDEDGSSPLYSAAFKGHVEVTQFLVEHGADPSVQLNNGWSPLHLAAFKGHVEVVWLLVEHGADPTVQAKDGSCPLHLATSNGHVEVTQFLVEHGADPTVQLKNRRSPLHLTLQNGHVEVTQFLVEHGAAKKKVGRLRGIWHRTKNMWRSHGSLSSRETPSDTCILIESDVIAHAKLG